MDAPDPTFAAQVRAARALLNWSQSELAERSGVSRPVIARVETTATDARSSTVRAIVAAFQAAGVSFVNGSNGSYGLHRRSSD